MPFTSVEKAFCVLEYVGPQSIKTVRRIFAQRFERSAFGKVPDKKQTWRRHKKFKKEGCLYRVKGSGRKSVSGETVDKIRQKSVNSPKKFIRVAVYRVSLVIVSVQHAKLLWVSKLVLLMDFFGLFTLFGEFYLPFLLTLTFGQIFLLCTSNLLS